MAVSKQHRDRGLPAAIMIVVLILAVFLAWSAFLIHAHFSYTSFIRALSDSTCYAYDHSGLLVTDGGGTSHRLTGRDVYWPYNKLSLSGPCIPQSQTPADSEALLVDFGDGSWMRVWAAEFRQSYRLDHAGVLILYQYPDGRRYCYMTDALTMNLLQPRLMHGGGAQASAKG